MTPHRKCRRRKQIRTWVQRVGLIGICTLVLLIPYCHATSTVQPAQSNIACQHLTPIPMPPVPNSIQEMAIMYANSVLAQIREAINCG